MELTPENANADARYKKIVYHPDKIYKRGQTPFILTFRSFAGSLGACQESRGYLYWGLHTTWCKGGTTSRMSFLLMTTGACTWRCCGSRGGGSGCEQPQINGDCPWLLTVTVPGYSIIQTSPSSSRPAMMARARLGLNTARRNGNRAIATGYPRCASTCSQGV